MLHRVGAGDGANLRHGGLALFANQSRGAQLDQLVGGERPVDFGEEPRRHTVAADLDQRLQPVGERFQLLARGC